MESICSETCLQIDWTRLIYLLTDYTIKQEVSLQVYFYDALIEGLKSIEDFEASNAMALNNMLLGLYAHNLYREV